MSWWENAYSGSPPWDIGEPQPEIVKLVVNREIPKGQVLDIGCGLADNSIFLAKNGYQVTCLDITSQAIDKGKAKAAKQKIQINFLVADALKLNKYFKEEFFNAVVDSGLFHSLDTKQRSAFAKQIRRALINGGKYLVLCFSDKEPGSWGRQGELAKKKYKKPFQQHLESTISKTLFCNKKR